MPDYGDMLSSGLLFSTLCFVFAVAWVAVGSISRSDAVPAMWPLAVLAVALAAAIVYATYASIGLLAIALGFVVTGAGLILMRDFTAPGRLLLLSHVQVVGWAVPYGIWFLTDISVSGLTRVLLFAGYPLFVIMLPVGLVSTYGAWEVLCRRTWRRARHSLPPTARDHYPKISIHVPARSEPADVVIGTLDHLAALDYPNFEVVVVDNNTPDEALWRPVEAHCRYLGPRFRFFHVEKLTGAKGGALNFALRHTADDAELIAVVDSDYYARPDFLSALVGFFDHPDMGFVQTPHAYRGWENSTYLTWCRWEYALFFHTTMVTLNERDAALIVGTMCIIRRQAIVDAGGWAEWCLTEDSELAIRIHSVGYSSIYVDEPFGRGLIPPTFAGFRSQRFRWTYGPIQELKKHVRLFLPGPLGRPSKLKAAHKLHHLHHGMDGSKIGIGMITMPLGIVAAASLIAHGERVAVPGILWFAGTAVLLSGFVLKAVVYRENGASLINSLGAFIMTKALSHIIALSSVSALLARPATWDRTNKFRSRGTVRDALRSVSPELAMAGLILGSTIAAFVLVPVSGLLTMMLLGAVYQSTNYICAPIVAVMAWHHNRSELAMHAEPAGVAAAEMAASEAAL